MYRPQMKTKPTRSFRSEDHRSRVRPRLDLTAQSNTSSLHSPNDKLRLITNAYSLFKQSHANELVVFEYGLTVTPSYGFKNIPQKVLNKPSVTRCIRRLLFDDLLPRLTNRKSTLGSVLIDINMESIFSLHAFKSNDQQESASTSDKLSFKNLPIESDLIQRLSVDIVIGYKKSHSLRSSDSCFLLLSAILHHQLLLRMIKYGSVYYLLHEMSNTSIQNSRLDLISEHIMGISLSGTRRNERGQDLVVINCSHCYVTQTHRLIDLLATFIAGRPTNINELTSDTTGRRVVSEIDSLKGDEPWFASFCSILDGFKCKAQILNDSLNIRFSKANISDPNKVGTFLNFYQDLGLNLMYPGLPCLISPSLKYPFIPLELCTLLPGQKVPIFRLSSTARNHLAATNKPKPDYSRDSSCKARIEIATMSKSELSSFGFKLGEHPIETSGLILPRPKLQYNDRNFRPLRDFWESGLFYQTVELVGNWCVINTVDVDHRTEKNFFQELSNYSTRFGLRIGEPYQLEQPKDTLLEPDALDTLIENCRNITKGRLRFIMFIIDSSSTSLNRMIHLSFDGYPNITATCLRVDSILNQRQHRAIFRTLVHKLNARLGGTNVTYHVQALSEIDLKPNDLMIVGLDVTHPDNELSGVSIVGCAYTYSQDLFKHRSLVWPQTARKEIIEKMGLLFRRLLREFSDENNGRLPEHIIIYRDGVSHEEFNQVETNEISSALAEIDLFCRDNEKMKPHLSYIVAQKRHTMRFFQVSHNNRVSNPPGGTLIDEEVISQTGREFYLYSNTSPQATARPLHYHVLQKGLNIDVLQKLTYFLCFNFGKCSGSLSMPSSLRYAHNAAYDARNRVITAREFCENKFYTNKFFC